MQSKKQEILNDINRVDADTKGELSPIRYKLAGNFSVKNVKNEFGSWNKALENAGLSERDKIIKDIQKTDNDIKGALSWNKYRKESDKYSLRDIRDNFGSWGNAKQEAGLKRDARKVSDEELEEDMKRVQKEIERPLTISKYNEYGKFSSGVFSLRDYTFAEFRDKIGLEAPEQGEPPKEALEAWKKELNDVRGRFSVEELKQKLSSTGYNYTSADVMALKKYLEEQDFQFSISSGSSSSKYYIKSPGAETIKDYYRNFLKKIPDDKEEWFMEMSGTGIGPKTLVAAIRYLTEDKTQKEISEEEDVSEVSLRNTKNKIVERFDLDKEMGKKNRSQDNETAEDGEEDKNELQEDITSKSKNELYTILEDENFNSLDIDDLDSLDSKSAIIEAIFSFNGFNSLEKLDEFIYRARKDEKSYILMFDDSTKTEEEFLESANQFYESLECDKIIIASSGFFTKSARMKKRKYMELWNRQEFSKKFNTAKRFFNNSDIKDDTMEGERQIEEISKLLGILVKLELDRNLDPPEKEKKKARYLKDSGLSNQQIADLLNKEKSTISGQLSRLKSID